jgi:hypothetical protein
MPFTPGIVIGNLLFSEQAFVLRECCDVFISEPGGHYKSACLSEVLKNTTLSPGFGFPGACG